MRRVTANTALVAALVGAGPAAAGSCVAEHVCASGSSCEGTVNACGTADRCHGVVNVCATATSCHADINVCGVFPTAR
jgi:hypothetical protein